MMWSEWPVINAAELLNQLFPLINMAIFMIINYKVRAQLGLQFRFKKKGGRRRKFYSPPGKLLSRLGDPTDERTQSSPLGPRWEHVFNVCVSVMDRLMTRNLIKIFYEIFPIFFALFFRCHSWHFKFLPHS